MTVAWWAVNRGVAKGVPHDPAAVNSMENGGLPCLRKCNWPSFEPRGATASPTEFDSRLKARPKSYTDGNERPYQAQTPMVPIRPRPLVFVTSSFTTQKLPIQVWFTSTIQNIWKNSS